MKHGVFTYKSSGISYYRFGTGPKPAVCFHGYGENASMFNFLENHAGSQFTFISLDLPFHGQTTWNDGKVFTHRHLHEIIDGILKQEKPGIDLTNTKLTVVGFSLGGRIALSLFQSIPERIERLVLMAPDGLKVNFWYWLSTQTRAGNNLFALTMRHPEWFFGFLKSLNRLKLVNASIFKFVNYYIGDEQVRNLLYKRWTVLRKLKPNLSRIKKYIRRHKTPVFLIYGKHDRIILPAVGERFKNGIEEYCTISIIHSGHQVLHEKHAAEILPALLH